MLCAAAFASGSCGDNTDDPGANSSQPPGAPGITTPQVRGEQGCDINVIAKGLENAGYDVAPSGVNDGPDIASRIIVRKGKLLPDILNSSVTVYVTSPHAEEAARTLSKPGRNHVATRQNVLFDVDDESDDDIEEMLAATSC
jgi:hypothetical protein